jgi:hypothetical protein
VIICETKVTVGQNIDLTPPNPTMIFIADFHESQDPTFRS